LCNSITIPVDSGHLYWLVKFRLPTTHNIPCWCHPTEILDDWSLINLKTLLLAARPFPLSTTYELLESPPQIHRCDNAFRAAFQDASPKNISGNPYSRPSLKILPTYISGDLINGLPIPRQTFCMYFGTCHRLLRITLLRGAKVWRTMFLPHKRQSSLVSLNRPRLFIYNNQSPSILRWSTAPKVHEMTCSNIWWLPIHSSSTCREMSSHKEIGQHAVPSSRILPSHQPSQQLARDGNEYPAR